MLDFDFLTHSFIHLMKHKQKAEHSSHGHRCPEMGYEYRRIVDQGERGNSNLCFVQSDSDCRNQHGISLSNVGNSNETNEEASLTQTYPEQIELLVTAPDPEISTQVEVAIMNDLSKRMKDCGLSKTKPSSNKRRLHINPGHLKTIPASIYRAFRGLVKRTKQPQAEKIKPGNLPIACFDEMFHLPFNLVPTVEATKDKSTNIICPGLNEAITFPFYYGNIDRHEAAEVLDGLEHGYFLLRNSFHSDFFFAVSFRCSTSTVHARICYNNGRYTFKMDDSLRFSSQNLLEFLTHYNEVQSSGSAQYVFDEPYLMKPVARKQVFSLQFLCTAAIASRCTPKGVKSLPLPNSIKSNILTSFSTD